MAPETIHPFFDGNGRVGRLLMMGQILIRGYAPALIRIEDQKAYYEGLAKADLGDYKGLTQVITQAVVRGYDLIGIGE